MASYQTIQQIQDLVTFPFRDPKWIRKLGIAYLLLLLSCTIILFPILIFLDGYAYRIMKRMISEGGEPYLPEWDDWKGLFNDGIRLFIPRFIISLPIILITILTGGIYFFSTYKLIQSIPDDPTMVNSLPIPMIGLLIILILFGGICIYSFALGLILPVLTGHIVAKDQMTAIFHVGEWWKIYKANFLGFILAFLFPFIIMPIVQIPISILSITFIFMFLIPLITPMISVFLLVISNAIYARAYAVGVQRLAQEQSTVEI